VARQDLRRRFLRWLIILSSVSFGSVGSNCYAAILSTTCPVGIGPWTAPSTDYPGIQFRAECVANSQNVSSAYADIVSWYPGLVTISGKVIDSHGETNVSGSFTFGIPARIQLANTSGGDQVQLLFEVSNAAGSLGTPNVYINSLPFNGSNIAGPITILSGPGFEVQGVCTGNPFGSWILTWLNGNVASYFVTWKGWSAGVLIQQTNRFPSNGPYSTTTTLPCEAPPFDSRVYFAVTRVIPIIPPHPIPH
jgi:hypothetical protein